MISRLLCFCLGILAVSPVWAQRADRDSDTSYPARHIRLITPFTAGSTLDIMARVVAERLASGLGHNVVVDNRPGANGIIGIDLVAKAQPDGYTMLITTGSFKDGRVRPLALTGPVRAPVLPDIPTFKEAGYADVLMTGMYGLWFPARTPQARVNRVHAEMRKAAAMPDLKAKLDEFGLVGVASTPAEFARFIRDDIALQAGVMKRAGIPQQ